MGSDAEGSSKQNTGERGSITPSSDICRVGVRIPPFWPEKPALWFAQLEGQFILSNITADQTKFYYAISQLDAQFASQVEDIIINPPSTNKFEKLKTELIKRLSASKQKRNKQLLMHEEMGDRRPSQFLRDLRSLAGPEFPEDLLKTLWANRLPQNMQPFIAAHDSKPLEDLAELADRIYDVNSSLPQLAVASTSKTGSESTLETMAIAIQDLTHQVHALTTRMDKKSRPGARSSQRSQPPQSRSDSSYRKYPICWYHSKYQSMAKRCQKPCDFKPENTQGGR